MLCDVRSRIIGRKQELFCLPAYQDEAQIYHIRRDITGHLAVWDRPRYWRRKKKKIKKDEPKREVFGLRKSTFGILNGSSCAFQKKISSLGAQVPAWPRFRAKRNSRREPSGRSGRELSGWQRQPRRRRRRRQQPPQQQQPPQDRPRQVDRAEWHTDMERGGRGLNRLPPLPARQWFTLAPESSPH